MKFRTVAYPTLQQLSFVALHLKQLGKRIEFTAKEIQKLRKKYSARILYTEYVFLATIVDTHTRIYTGNGQTMEDVKV